MTIAEQKAALHKKQFGQFFSGKMVADELFSLLPKGVKWNTVVDPMVGVGDMLHAVARHVSYKPQMFGVEIDEEIAHSCAEKLVYAKIEHGDAFKCQSLTTSSGWDLVITNPPYVRYQLQNGENGVMPTSKEIRDNLLKQIDTISYFSAPEKRLFINLANNYSGLADMAVPAWILCAALVKKGGYLAIVVPETWLNRDYASPIHYLLSKCFHIETIARDTNAHWFPEAMVKTCLVVANRTEIRPLDSGSNLTTRIIENSREYFQPSSTIFPHLCGVKEAKKWALEEDKTFFAQRISIPYELGELIGEDNSVQYVTLSEMGIDCGQGLRTGANDFFYVTIKKDEGTGYLVKSRAWDQGGKEYFFTKDEVVLALQNRGEVDGLLIRPEKLTSALVYPRGQVQGDLHDYILSAEKYKDKKGRRFKDYSAVKPNEITIGAKTVREWFRIPTLAQRHLPHLCITRVSSRMADCIFVPQCDIRPIVIDANMITLWSNNERSVRIALAVLNSTWSKLNLELICTIMGGGALKIEASHLKRLLLPKLGDPQLNDLERIGDNLSKSGIMNTTIKNEIDEIMVSAFRDNTLSENMRGLLNKKFLERSIR